MKQILVLCLLFVFLTTIILQIEAYSLMYHSFQPPFEEFDSLTGTRSVPHWRSSGTTVVNSNFVRLTPDRQSKKGAIWSRRPLGTATFSSILKFRISGQGKNFFGDGLAFWVVQNSFFEEGPVHGFKESFKGLGIIFDTFKNQETIAHHKDISVIVNDGEKTYEMMTKVSEGCNMNFRYHNERDDFSVESSSSAKIVVEHNNIQVLIDAQNTGEWTECVKILNMPLHPEWLRDANIGISATTGQLADNHDVISLQTYSDYYMMEEIETQKKNERLFPSLPEESNEFRIGRMEDAVNSLYEKIDFYDHHVEHELTAIFDHIESVTNKLKQREDTADTRIDGLEELVSSKVEDSLSNRIQALEQQLHGKVDFKLHHMERDIKAKVGGIESTATAAATNAASQAVADKVTEAIGGQKAVCQCSQWPFYLSIICNILACGWFYYVFNVSKKRHLL